MFRKFYFILAICFFYTSSYAAGINVVPVANKNIQYKSKIYSYNVRLIQANEKFKCKKYLDVISLKKNKYFAKHYIAKDRAICADDVFVPKTNVIKFKFGNLEIERSGTIIRETDEYIRIKNFDGTIDNIYKDGRDR